MDHLPPHHTKVDRATTRWELRWRPGKWFGFANCRQGNVSPLSGRNVTYHSSIAKNAQIDFDPLTWWLALRSRFPDFRKSIEDVRKAIGPSYQKGKDDRYNSCRSVDMKDLLAMVYIIFPPAHNRPDLLISMTYKIASSFNPSHLLQVVSGFCRMEIHIDVGFEIIRQLRPCRQIPDDEMHIEHSEVIPTPVVCGICEFICFGLLRANSRVSHPGEIRFT